MSNSTGLPTKTGTLGTMLSKCHLLAKDATDCRALFGRYNCLTKYAVSNAAIACNNYNLTAKVLSRPYSLVGLVYDVDNKEYSIRALD